MTKQASDDTGCSTFNDQTGRDRMPKISRTIDRRHSPHHGVSAGALWQLLALLLVAVTFGCAGVETASTQAVPTSVVADAGLESARLVYHQPVRVTEDGRADGVRTLAIAYPHPSGRPHEALAEVVVARPDAPPMKGPRRWLGGGSSWTSKSPPGLGLGDGVVEAKSLDIPAAEVDQLVRGL